MKKVIVLFFVFTACLHGGEAITPHPEEIIDLQDGVKGQLKNLKNRLQEVSDRLEKISLNDAEKVRSVDEEFRKRDIVHQMEKISEKLQNHNYTSAYELQTKLINQLHDIIRELEGRSQSAKNWEDKLSKVREAGKNVKDLLDAQNKLKKESEESVSVQSEAMNLNDMARDIDRVLSEQEGLSKKLPDEKLDDEKYAEELEQKLDDIVRKQEGLLGKVENSPEEHELNNIRNRAEDLKTSVENDKTGTKEDKLVEDIASDVKNTLGDKELGEMLKSSWKNKTPGWKNNIDRVLRRIKEKSSKGAILSSKVSEQTEIEYKVRELSNEVEKKLADSADISGNSFSKGKDSLKDAAGDMKNVSKALSQGQKKQAAQGQQKAIDRLRDAQKAFADISRALKNRNRFDRAEYKQKKLRKKTAELKKKSEKLRKKLPGKDRAETLRRVEDMLDKAGEEMDRASGEFAENKPEGLESADKASDQLKSARDMLEKESVKKLRRLDELRKLSKKQEELKKKTKDLANSLKKGNETSLRRAGTRLQKAEEQMGKASSDFNRGDASEGARAQKKAVEELEKAEQELREEEDELERLKQEEELTDMVQLLVKIRDGQKEILKEITGANEERKETGSLSRQKKLLLRKIAGKQKEIITESEKVRELLEKEKARVYAFVVVDILGDMIQIKDGISGRNPDTGRFVQILGAEVIEKINHLLRSLKEELVRRKEDEQKQQKQQGPSGPQKRVLIPPVAEALMLKRMQLDLNAQTEDLERSRQVNDGNLNEAMERRLKRLALKQGALESLTNDIAKEFFGPLPEDENISGEKENETENENP